MWNVLILCSQVESCTAFRFGVTEGLCALVVYEFVRFLLVLPWFHFLYSALWSIYTLLSCMVWRVVFFRWLPHCLGFMKLFNSPSLTWWSEKLSLCYILNFFLCPGLFLDLCSVPQVCLFILQTSAVVNMQRLFASRPASPPCSLSFSVFHSSCCFVCVNLNTSLSSCLKRACYWDCGKFINELPFMLLSRTL